MQTSIELNPTPYRMMGVPQNLCPLVLFQNRWKTEKEHRLTRFFTWKTAVKTGEKFNTASDAGGNLSYSCGTVNPFCTDVSVDFCIG